MDVELSDHLGYHRGDRSGHGSGNSRNGTTPKTLRSEVGDIALDGPRDRAGTFSPVLVPKGARSVGGLDEQVISLYGGGPPGAPRARRNRQRFDLALTDGDLATEVDRLVALWATPLGGATEGRVELADPDGNEFCLNLVGQEACRRVDLRWEKSSTVP